MKITVLGTRGFPQIQGGVETHCENLYPRLVKKGCEVVVFTRTPYVTYHADSFEGVSMVPLTCPKNKFLEAFVHTFKGVLVSKKLRPDILHVHAIGPALCVPLARLMGLSVLMTHHGPDYERKKWGQFAKIVLKIGEYVGCRWSNEIIAISAYIAEKIKKKYGKIAVVIPNGVIHAEIVQTDNALNKYRLKKERYILSVGRFVPEKGYHNLIRAFNKIQLNGWKLALVGDADHPDRYSLNLKEQAGKNNNIILTGVLTEKPLQELYSHAGLFVLPSYYEGLPIVLLEAMSYGLLCLASDIPANRLVGLPDDNYFPAGNIEYLARKLKEFVNKSLSTEQKSHQIEMVRERYDWNEIAKKTLEVYKKVIAAG